jgi:hypothetical protein
MLTVQIIKKFATKIRKQTKSSQLSLRFVDKQSRFTQMTRIKLKISEQRTFQTTRNIKSNVITDQRNISIKKCHEHRQSENKDKKHSIINCHKIHMQI